MVFCSLSEFKLSSAQLSSALPSFALGNPPCLLGAQTFCYWPSCRLNSKCPVLTGGGLRWSSTGPSVTGQVCLSNAQIQFKKAHLPYESHFLQPRLDPVIKLIFWHSPKNTSSYFSAGLDHGWEEAKFIRALNLPRSAPSISTSRQLSSLPSLTTLSVFNTLKCLQMKRNTSKPTSSSSLNASALQDPRLCLISHSHLLPSWLSIQ